MTRLTMSPQTIAERVRANAAGLTAVDLKAIEAFLEKAAYRADYNKRPDVVAKRKARNAKKAQEAKRTAALIRMLLQEKAAGTDDQDEQDEPDELQIEQNLEDQDGDEIVARD